jgi:flagellar biosynthesis protein FlhG
MTTVVDLRDVAAGQSVAGEPAAGLAPGSKTSQAEQLIARQLRAQPSPRPGGRIIAITSGKGGVGKSNIAASLAVVLARSGCRVALIDADLGMGNLDVLFGVAPRAGLAQVLDGSRRLAEVLTPLPCGVDLAVNTASSPDAADEPGFMNLLEGLGELRHRYDCTIIDCGAGIGREIVDFATLADQVLVVTTPEPTAYADAYGTIKALTRQAVRARLSVIVNMVSSRQEAKQVHMRLASVASRFLGRTIYDAGSLPRDQRVVEAVTRMAPFAEMFPKCKSAKELECLSRKLQPRSPIRAFSVRGRESMPNRRRLTRRMVALWHRFWAREDNLENLQIEA